MTVDDRLGTSGPIDPRIGTTAAAWPGALGGSVPIGERREDGDP